MNHADKQWGCNAEEVKSSFITNIKREALQGDNWDQDKYTCV